MKELWKNDLAEITQEMDCWQRKYILLYFLPKFWPNKFDALTWLNIILIAPGTKKADEPTRKYILSHEYGHIKSNHNLFTLAFYVAAITYALACAKAILYLFFISLVIIIALLIIVNKNSLKFEIQADNVALKLTDPKTVLNGFLWMAIKTETLHKKERQSRLANIKNKVSPLLL